MKQGHHEEIEQVAKPEHCEKPKYLVNPGDHEQTEYVAKPKHYKKPGCIVKPVLHEKTEHAVEPEHYEKPEYYETDWIEKTVETKSEARRVWRNGRRELSTEGG